MHKHREKHVLDNYNTGLSNMLVLFTSENKYELEYLPITLADPVSQRNSLWRARRKFCSNSWVYTWGRYSHGNPLHRGNHTADILSCHDCNIILQTAVKRELEGNSQHWSSVLTWWCICTSSCCWSHFKTWSQIQGPICGNNILLVTLQHKI